MSQTTIKKKLPVSPRLMNGMKSLVSVKVQGMNLRGTGQFEGFLWNKKEIFTTDFILSVTFGHFNWTVSLDFESCKAFLLHVFPSKRQLYDESFPKILDIDDDVFVLVNRKESMETFLTEVMNTMDFVVYQPLYKFLCPKYEMQPLLKKIMEIQAFCRQFLVQSSMENRLLSFFSLDLKELVNRLKSGIMVALIPSCMSGDKLGPLHKKVLYLIENPHEYGLSRLCLISYEEFFHTLEVIKEKTDAVGLCSPDFVSSIEGVYLSDIAEIRGGMASHNFSRFVDLVEKRTMLLKSEVEDSRSLLSHALGDSNPPPISSPTSGRASDIPLEQVRVDHCLSIIAFESSLDIQLLDVDIDHSRDWFIDMLSLLSIKSLMTSHPPDGNYMERETVLRLRKWRRVKTNSSYAVKNSRSNSRSTSISSSNILDGDFAELTLASIGGKVPPISRFPPPNSNLHPRRLSEAQLFMEILCESIEIEEEIFSDTHLTHINGTIECNTLWLDPNLMRIYIKPISAEGSSTSCNMNMIRGINVDDISEVRPGKISFACDGTPYRTSLCLIGSEGTICLPVDSVDIRNALLRQFQSFVLAYRTPSGCVTTSNVFTTTAKKNSSELPLTPTRAKPAERFKSANTSRRRSSFKSNYPESLPPTHGAGYTRRKSTPAGFNGFGTSHHGVSLNAEFSDVLGDVNALWIRKSESETPFSTNEIPFLSSSLPTSLETPLSQDVSSPAPQNLFKKLFVEVNNSDEDDDDKEINERLPSPPASPTMSVESYVSDEDMEGHVQEDHGQNDEKQAGTDSEVPVNPSPMRRASAAFFNVVRRNSTTVSDDSKQVLESDSAPVIESTTVIVGDLPVFNEGSSDHVNDRNNSPAQSVESYQSDEDIVNNTIDNDDDDSDEGDNVKKSAIRRASLKMINLVRRMSSTGDDDIGINSSSTSIVHDDEKQ